MLMQAFAPLCGAVATFANSIALAITAGSVPTQLPAGWLGSVGQVEVYNTGPNDCWITFGATAAEAVAAIPTSGTPANGYAIPKGANKIVTAPPQAKFIAVIGAAAGGTLYASNGEGV